MLLDRAWQAAVEGRAPALAGGDRDLLAFWRERFADGGGAPRLAGCPCKEHPPQARFGGRLLAGWQEVGDPVTGEAGLPWAAGLNAAAEAGADVAWGGRWWGAVTVRASGPVASRRPLAPDDPLAWPGWPVATGRPQVGAIRTDEGDWTLDAPRALVGVRLGRWSLGLGWEPRRVGPGLGGGLTLDHGGESFPALTARRTAPFRWRGVMKPLAPSELLMRAGVLSQREVGLSTDEGRIVTQQHPWFMQWQLGWRPTSWSRFTATHAVMAAAQEGTLWPDLLQVNFPVIGSTWKETRSGPVTDRLFAVGMEAAWRDAPWPLLPAAAGRVWWEYGGTDFLPSGPGGVIPQISIPASVAGFELLSPAWDLACEYTELRHETGLWYSNSGFSEGYTQDGWLLGHELGGSGESVTGAVRVRPSRAGLEACVVVGWARWGLEGRTPGDGERRSLEISIARLPTSGRRAPLLWSLHAEVRREEAARPGEEPARRTWGRAWLEVGLP